jgi:hypothetical protein
MVTGRSSGGSARSPESEDGRNLGWVRQTNFVPWRGTIVADPALALSGSLFEIEPFAFISTWEDDGVRSYRKIGPLEAVA